MSTLSLKERMKLMEMASEVAAGAAGNQNVIWMIEFQEQLIERLYRKMEQLLLEDLEEEKPGKSGKKKDKG